jgi:hypothetical protein
VDGGELDVGHPAPAVVAEAPCVLDAGPLAPFQFDLDRARWIEATFLEQADRLEHGFGLSRPPARSTAAHAMV